MDRKTIIVLLVSLLVLVHLSCSDDEFMPDCTWLFNVDISEVECLAETLADLCETIYCDTEPTVGKPAFSEGCEAVGCTTLDCTNGITGGIMTDLAYNDETRKLTSTVFLDGQNLGNVDCGFIVSN